MFKEIAEIAIFCYSFLNGIYIERVVVGNVPESSFTKWVLRSKY